MIWEKLNFLYHSDFRPVGHDSFGEGVRGYYNEWMSLASCQKIVIKLGTKVVTGSGGGFEQGRLANIVADVAALKKAGKEVLIVSSGAVGLGRQVLNQHEKGSLSFRQACAAVGQNLLMTAYQGLFASHGLTVAQVLVTAGDLADRGKYLNLRAMLTDLLALGIVPIINENDSVSTMELMEYGKEKVFGDNDKLSALVACKLGADALILLTDVEAVYDKNPKIHQDAKRLPVLRGAEDLRAIDKTGKSGEGRGGMDSKIQAVQLASLSGVLSVIAAGMGENIVADLISTHGQQLGTQILPIRKASARQQWIGFSSGVEGALVVNHGAQSALEEGAASLLPIGVCEVLGEFAEGQVVSVQNESGTEVARGIVAFSSEDLKKVIGKKSAEISKILGKKCPDEAIHRDRLFVFNEKVL